MSVRIGIGVKMWSARSSLDPNAQAFITAAGITDATQQTAINTLVLDLKAASLYSKFYTLYPLVGGSATSHKFNLINPLDTDNAFRLIFSGGFTHNANGVTGNGTNNFANTFLNTINYNINSLSFGVYSRTNSNGQFYDIGNFSSSTSPINCGTNMQSRFVDFFFGSINQDDAPTVANTNSAGFLAKSRVNSTQEITHIRGSNTTQTKSSLARPNLNMYFTAGNLNGSRNFSSARNYAFAYIGEGLTTSELIALNTIIITFQTTLGRNV